MKGYSLSLLTLLLFLGNLSACHRKETIEKTDFVFEDADYNIQSSYIPEPFQPLKISQTGNESFDITVWGRVYSFSEGPLPEKITSQNSPLFSKKPIFHIKVNEHPSDIQWSKSNIAFSSGERILLTSQATVDTMTLLARTAIEYDGMIEVAIEMTAPSGTIIEDWFYEIHPTLQVAQFYNRFLDYDFEKQRIDKSSFLDSAGLFPEAQSFPFYPVVSFGNYDIGLEWVCETDGDWVYRHPENVERLSKPLFLGMENGEPVMRIRPIADDLKFNNRLISWNDRFSFFPAPMRPPTKGWRNRRILSEGQAGLYFRNNKGAGTKLISIAHPSPRGNYFPQWFGLPAISHLPEHQRKHREWMQRVHDFFEADGVDRVGVVPYAALTLPPAHHPMTMSHFDDWSASVWFTGAPAGPKWVLSWAEGYEEGNPYSYALCGHRNDYFDWYFDTLLEGLRSEPDFEGIYFDYGSLGFSCQKDPAIQGKEPWRQAWRFLNIRRFYKRLYEWARKERPGFVILQHSHGYPRMIAAFSDFHIVGEALNGIFCKKPLKKDCIGNTPESIRNYEPDYLSLPTGWIEGKFLPHYGGPTTIIPEQEWAFPVDENGPLREGPLWERALSFQRGLLALALVHEIPLLNGNFNLDIAREIYRAIDMQFGSLDNTRFYPWWSSFRLIVTPEGLRVSAYIQEEEKKALLIFANLTHAPINGPIILNQNDLGIPEASKYKDIEKADTPFIPFQNGSFPVNIPPEDFRLLLLK